MENQEQVFGIYQYSPSEKTLSFIFKLLKRIGSVTQKQILHMSIGV